MCIWVCKAKIWKWHTHLPDEAPLGSIVTKCMKCIWTQVSHIPSWRTSLAEPSWIPQSFCYLFSNQPAQNQMRSTDWFQTTSPGLQWHRKCCWAAQLSGSFTVQSLNSVCQTKLTLMIWHSVTIEGVSFGVSQHSNKLQPLCKRSSQPRSMTQRCLKASLSFRDPWNKLHGGAHEHSVR